MPFTMGLSGIEWEPEGALGVESETESAASTPEPRHADGAGLQSLWEYVSHSVTASLQSAGAASLPASWCEDSLSLDVAGVLPGEALSADARRRASRSKQE